MQLIYKIIYQKQVNYLLRLVNKLLVSVFKINFKLPPSGEISFEVEGKKVRLATNQTNYPTHLIYWNGYLNFEYTPLFIAEIKKVDTFIDIGSNIGYYSILGAILNPEMKAFAFEPALGPKHYLKENIQLNKLANIQISEMALSDKKGELDFYEVANQKYSYLNYNLSGEGNAAAEKKNKKYQYHKVKASTLNDFFKAYDGSIDLIKIDTEGTEHLILKGGIELIKKHRPIIIVETLYDKVEKDLEEIMKPLGYRFFNVVNQKLVEVDTITRTFDNGVRDCFLMP